MSLSFLHVRYIMVDPGGCIFDHGPLHGIIMYSFSSIAQCENFDIQLLFYNSELVIEGRGLS